MNGSVLYRGIIRHRRFTPVLHEFRYRITMPLLDLATVENELNVPGLLSARHPALGWFRRMDYAGDPAQSLSDMIRDTVEAETGWRPDGRIRLLTNLRYWGFVMNPISIFYCDDNDGQLRYLVLQVTNTPWREKTLYVVRSEPEFRNQNGRFAKRMHVSPFHPMNMTYICRFRVPESRLFFHLENHRSSRCETDATLNLERVPMTLPRLIGLVIRQPSMSMKTGVGIYWQALKLRLKQAPVYPHPKSHDAAHAQTQPQHE
ncbi:MAG: DUF1365 domain-containing protein [Gammaproteobacteria bacterium]|nr:DUF1365 domain-containing protein [Gammaproteobacteria bacterium]MCY4228786.1 DUF1365 domain-containing protein [Gammaproteobacteria bacterium]